MIGVGGERIAPVAVITIAVAAAILLAGCGGPSAQLRALKEDPLGRYAPPGARLVDTDEDNEGSTLGKPVYAAYSRVFELPDGDPERQLRQAVDAAAAAGWTITDPKPIRTGGDLVQNGEKRLATGRAEVGITVFPNGPPSSDTNRPTMLIWMRHFNT